MSVSVYLEITRKRLSVIQKIQALSFTNPLQPSYHEVDEDGVILGMAAEQEDLTYIPGGDGERELSLIVEDAIETARAEGSPVVYIRPENAAGEMNSHVQPGADIAGIPYYVIGTVQYGIQPHTFSAATVLNPPRHGHAKNSRKP
jgi:hypothetical protein